MQLGIRLHDTIDGTLEQRLAYVKNQGFACAHIALKKLDKNLPDERTALTPGYSAYLRNTFWANQMDIAVLGCYLNVATPNLEKYEEFKARYFANIALASQMNCGVVGTETGAPNEAYSFEPACRSEETFELFLKRLTPILEYAEKMGVIFAIEPVTKHIIYDAKTARKALDRLHAPNLRIIFDPVNLLDEGNCGNKEDVIAEAIELLHNEVAVLHLKDYVLEDGKMKAVACGNGEMKYDEILKFVKKEKPYMHATLENTNPENAETARKFIQGIYDGIVL